MRNSSVFLAVSALLLSMLSCTLAWAQSQETHLLQGSVKLGAQKPSLDDQPADASDIPAIRAALKETEKSDATPSDIPKTPAPKPLDPVLWPGNYFDKEVATALLKDSSQGDAIWKKIPGWQAGDWVHLQSTTTRACTYVDGQTVFEKNPEHVYTSQGGGTIGSQKDKRGDIWEHFVAGYWTTNVRDDGKTYSYITLKLPGTGDYPDAYIELVVFDLNKSGKIETCFRARTWSKFIYVAPGIMKEEQVHTAFDKAGAPETSAWNTTLLKRIGPFIASKEPSSDFLIYLAENDLWDLIPASSEAQKQAYLKRIAKTVLLDADLTESLDPDPTARQRAKATKAKLKAYADANTKPAKQ